jgi:hypothetical protein
MPDREAPRQRRPVPIRVLEGALVLSMAILLAACGVPIRIAPRIPVPPVPRVAPVVPSLPRAPAVRPIGAIPAVDPATLVRPVAPAGARRPPAAARTVFGAAAADDAARTADEAGARAPGRGGRGQSATDKLLDALGNLDGGGGSSDDADRNGPAGRSRARPVPPRRSQTGR